MDALKGLTENEALLESTADKVAKETAIRTVADRTIWEGAKRSVFPRLLPRAGGLLMYFWPESMGEPEANPAWKNRNKKPCKKLGR